MTYIVEISPIAYSQIRDCALFLQLVNLDSARKFLNDIFDSIGSLKDMPQRFPLASNEYCLPPDFRKMVIDNRYIVLYKIDGCSVFVDYVLDIRTDIGKLFK